MKVYKLVDIHGYSQRTYSNIGHIKNSFSRYYKDKGIKRVVREYDLTDAPYVDIIIEAKDGKWETDTTICNHE